MLLPVAITHWGNKAPSKLTDKAQPLPPAQQPLLAPMDTGEPERP